MTVAVFLNHVEPNTNVLFIGTNYSFTFVAGTAYENIVREEIGRADIERISVDGSILYCSVNDYFYKERMKRASIGSRKYKKYTDTGI